MRGRPSSRWSTRSPRPSWTGCGRVGGPGRAARPHRPGHARALAGRAAARLARRGGARARRRPWSRSRWPRTATPRSTTSSAYGWSRRTPDPTRSSPWATAIRTATIPTTSRPIVDDRPAVAGASGARAVLHRPVGQRQVHGRPGRDRRAARVGRAHGHQPGRRRRTPEPLGRPDVQPRGPRDQHPPDRLGRRRDLAARRRRGVQPDRAVRRDPPGRPGDDRRGRRCVLPGPRRDPARGVRAS